MWSSSAFIFHLRNHWNVCKNRGFNFDTFSFRSTLNWKQKLFKISRLNGISCVTNIVNLFFFRKLRAKEKNHKLIFHVVLEPLSYPHAKKKIAKMYWNSWVYVPTNRHRSQRRKSTRCLKYWNAIKFNYISQKFWFDKIFAVRVPKAPPPTAIGDDDTKKRQTERRDRLREL